jgi:hypothetical protein
MNATVTAAAIGVGGSVIVALAAFWANVKNTNKTTALTLRAVELTEQGQVTDRYTKAIEQLGSDKLDVRIGAVYALERVARDSPRDHPTVMEVLAAFVREHSREPWPPAEPGAETPKRTTRPDVQAAATTIGRRNLEHSLLLTNLARATLIRADLNFANLSSANLLRADLTRATLLHANLTGADLHDADLHDADLIGADLGRADLSDADLTGAKLHSAHLTRADLTDANLSSAKLPSADLTGADLHHADLHDTDLRGADLTRADLHDADLGLADLTGANLTATIYLDTFPVPEGWVKDPGSGRLRRASEDTGDAPS